MQESQIKNHTRLLIDNNLSISVFRITALWAFSESAFGGILHALSIPFKGIFLSSAAVLFISLIAVFSGSKKEVLKATLIVIIIKALVSPHSPFMTYLSVIFQGSFGFFLFSSKRFYKIPAIILGTLALLFSGFQKIILLTILFGDTLWKSIDVFVRQVSNEFLNFGHSTSLNYGYLFAGLYVLIHLAAGILIGFYASKLPDKILHFSKQLPENILQDDEIIFSQQKRKRKRWFLKPTGLMIFILSILLIIYSYFSPSFTHIKSIEILIMILRSLVLTLVWYFIFSPIVNKFFSKFLSSKKTVYAQEIDKILNLFPKFKRVVTYSWKESFNNKKLSRILPFISNSFYYLLLMK